MELLRVSPALSEELFDSFSLTCWEIPCNAVEFRFRQPSSASRALVRSGRTCSGRGGRVERPRCVGEMSQIMGDPRI